MSYHYKMSVRKDARTMTKECIDEFLAKYESVVQNIRSIAVNYSIEDFVKAEKPILEYFETGVALENQGISSCIYNVRKGYFRLDIESVESRLTTEYMEFLHDILTTREEIDKVFYIVAYHYLMLCKQLGYQLTVADSAPFPFFGKEMSPLAKTNYNSFKKMSVDGLHRVMRHFDESDLVYYNQCYRECGNHHHACKHFSLLQELVDFEFVVNKYEFCYKFERALNLFVFQYRVIYTTEQLYLYMSREAKERTKRKCGLIT